MSRAVHDPAAHALVLKAISLADVSGCFEWDRDEARRVRNETAIVPEHIRGEVCEFVKAGGKVSQRRETRVEKQDRREYWYKIVLPVPGFKHGVFVELELTVEDPDYPVATILNAHEQKK